MPLVMALSPLNYLSIVVWYFDSIVVHKERGKTLISSGMLCGTKLLSLGSATITITISLLFYFVLLKLKGTLIFLPPYQCLNA
jgi:hypothetical protein